MSNTELPEQHSEEHLELSRAEFDRENLSDADIEQIREQREGKEPDGSFMRWVITLFGTGVGAGILFLPINAGSFGFWPLVIATLLIGPMVFLSHRTYARIVSASPVKGLDVLQVITALTGRKRGFASAVLYWLGIYPTVLIYAISITNTLDSFIVNQLGGAQVSRWVLALVAVGVMTGAYAFGKKLTLWLANALVYPLIIALAAVSLYLIPSWDFAGFRSYESSYPVWQGLLLILPVLVFSFSHMAALSQFALDTQKKMDGDVAATEREVSKVELVTAILLVAFTMFFVWSCSLALGADGMDAAREQNVPVLSYLANETDAPFMAWMSPIIAICAIITSYFGHLLGTEEGTAYLVRSVA
ncbi:aromatic amino acid transport family protein, partial [uncultured Corynebacterium sp.]|uniref:aromatic amino acid transport family protein n=1 Tax=uncultured Corynebacterium sp. TaxID=159447 RepID=UPI00259BB4F1